MQFEKVDNKIIVSGMTTLNNEDIKAGITRKLTETTYEYVTEQALIKDVDVKVDATKKQRADILARLEQIDNWNFKEIGATKQMLEKIKGMTKANCHKLDAFINVYEEYLNLNIKLKSLDETLENFKSL
jgi:hypothetical protein